MTQNAKVVTAKPARPSELNQQIWAVINHKEVIKTDLFYEEAVCLAQATADQSGVCIVINAAAARMASK